MTSSFERQKSYSILNPLYGRTINLHPRISRADYCIGDAPLDRGKIYTRLLAEYVFTDFYEVKSDVAVKLESDRATGSTLRATMQINASWRRMLAADPSCLFLITSMTNGTYDEEETWTGSMAKVVKVINRIFLK